MYNLEQIRELMQTCVEIGYIKGQVAMSPSQDKIRKKDAEAMLMRNGLPKNLLQRWVGQGLLIANKGERNSPIWFSLTQLIETIGAVKNNSILSKIQQL